MTTIAYRDGIMAADSLVTSNDVRRGAVAKIGRFGVGIAGGIVGYAGWSGLLDTVVSWLENGAPADARPTLHPDTSFSAIVVWPNGIVTILDKTFIRTDIDGEFFAEGSGNEFALGAMAMGAKARQAVEIAARFDIYTGGRISTLSL